MGNDKGANCTKSNKFRRKNFHCLILETMGLVANVGFNQKQHILGNYKGANCTKSNKFKRNKFQCLILEILGLVANVNFN